MKYASLLLAAGLLIAAAPPPTTAELTLALSTRAPGGRIAVAVYRHAEAMRRGEHAIRTLMTPRTGPVTLAVIPDLPPGRYAVAAFHDTDGNGRLSTWPMGPPKEAYGFSRNARGMFGPPPFEDAAFDLPAAGAHHEISLR